MLPQLLAGEKNFLVETGTKGGSRDTGERFRMLCYSHHGLGCRFDWEEVKDGFQQTGKPRDRVSMLCNTIFAASVRRCGVGSQIPATALRFVMRRLVVSKKPRRVSFVVSLVASASHFPARCLCPTASGPVSTTAVFCC